MRGVLVLSLLFLPACANCAGGEEKAAPTQQQSEPAVAREGGSRFAKPIAPGEQRLHLDRDH